MFNRFTKLAMAVAVGIFAGTQLMLSGAQVVAAANPHANVNGITHSNNAQDKSKKDDHDHQSPQNSNQQPTHTPGSSTNKQDNHEKVRICHRTASRTNPYVNIEVDRNAVDGISGNSGNQADHYGEHQGPVFTSSLPKHTEWGDIIPPVPGAHNGYNWTVAGQAIWNNDCKIASPSQTPGHNDNQDKVTLCHATGSGTNPYVRITVSTAGAYNGHMGHQDERDIIPPFTYQGRQYSRNWDAAGQSTWNNDCKPVGGMGSGPATPSDPTSPTTIADPAAPRLANTGANIWISSLIGFAIIATSVAVGVITRRKLAFA